MHFSEVDLFLKEDTFLEQIPFKDEQISRVATSLKEIPVSLKLEVIQVCIL